MENQILKVIILSIVMLSCSSKLSKDEMKDFKSNIVNLEESLEWDEIESFITHFSKENIDLTKGRISLVDFIKKNYPNFNTTFIENIDFFKSKEEFLKWIKVPLTQELLEPNVKSL